MIRRVSKKKLSPLKAKVLEEMRLVREQLEKQHPGMLDDVRNKYESAQQVHKEPEVIHVEDCSDELAVDKKKNLMTVIEFAQMKTGSSEFQNRLKKLLLKSMN